MHQGSNRKPRKYPRCVITNEPFDTSRRHFRNYENDRWYKRIVRRGIHSVKLEVLLVAIGHNLYKYQKKDEKTELPHRFKKNFYGVGEVPFFAHDFSHLYTTGTKVEM